MLSGCCDVVNKDRRIDFASSDDIHTMAHLYSRCCVRCAVPQATRFTAAAAIRFTISGSGPKLGEMVLDPACVRAAAGRDARAPPAEEIQHHTSSAESCPDLRGIEENRCPHLLRMMNSYCMASAGRRHRSRQRAHLKPITQISKSDPTAWIWSLHEPAVRWRGGEEPPEQLSTLTSLRDRLAVPAADKRLAEGQPLQDHRARTACSSAAAWAPRIKRQLLGECNLHNRAAADGVFEPLHRDPVQTSSSSRKTGRTRRWFWDPPDGRKKYSNQNDIEEFKDCPSLVGMTVRRRSARGASGPSRVELSTSTCRELAGPADLRFPALKAEG